MKLQRLMEVVEKVDDYADADRHFARTRRAQSRRPARATSSPNSCRRSISAASPPRSAKQVIVQKVREAERERQYDEYKDRIGEIVNGIVKRVEYGNVIVDLGRGEAIIRRDELMPRETFRTRRPRPRLCLRRAPRSSAARRSSCRAPHPQFMAKLFAHGSAGNLRRHHRDQGGGARSGQPRQDRRHLARQLASIRSAPASACAAAASRRWSASCRARRSTSFRGRRSAATFIVNALPPAEVAKVVLDEDAERIEVVVPDDQLSLAIGRRGQNVRLASQLTGWDIDILTEAGESGAPPEGVRRAPLRCSWKPSTSTRWSARCWPPKASPASRKSPGVDRRRNRLGSMAADEDTASEIQTRAPRISGEDRGRA